MEGSCIGAQAHRAPPDPPGALRPDYFLSGREGRGSPTSDDQGLKRHKNRGKKSIQKGPAFGPEGRGSSSPPPILPPLLSRGGITDLRKKPIHVWCPKGEEEIIIQKKPVPGLCLELRHAADRFVTGARGRRGRPPFKIQNTESLIWKLIVNKKNLEMSRNNNVL